MLSLEEIQSWWEVPCISHFCHQFGDILDVSAVSIEALERGILHNTISEENCYLTELIIFLLKSFVQLRGVLTNPGKTRDREITHTSLTYMLRQIFRYNNGVYDTENFNGSGVTFQSLDVRKKLGVILALFNKVVNCRDVQVYLVEDTDRPDTVRVEPLGYDSKYSRYWYFSGTRLYREYVNEDDNKTNWEIVCFLLNDWTNFANTFKRSKSPDESNLYKTLVQQIKKIKSSSENSRCGTNHDQVENV